MLRVQRLVHAAFGWLQWWGLRRGLTHLADVTPLSERVVRVLGANPSPMTLQGTNTYLVGTGKRRVLVDTGSAGMPAYVQRLQSVLHELDVELQEIVITHWHPDHVGGVPDIRRALGEEVRARKFVRPEAEDPPGLEPLLDGDVITTEGATLTAVHTPGHSTDHCVLLLKEDNILFSGDCILGETTAVFEDFSDYMRSLQRLLEMEPSQIYPGHGPVVENPTAKIQEYIQHRLAREQQILAALRDSAEPCTVADIVTAVYTDIPFYMRRPASINVSHHLSKLAKDGVVVAAENGQYSLAKSADPPPEKDT